MINTTYTHHMAFNAIQHPSGAAGTSLGTDVEELA